MKKFFFDMDGVQSDWVSGFSKHFPQYNYDEFNSFSKAEYDVVQEQVATHPSYYADLNPHWDVVNLIKSMIDEGYDVSILTSCGDENPEHIAQQKREWIKRVYLGYDVDLICVTKSAHKARYAGPDTVLIDDRDKCLRPFAEAGGHVIKYDHGVTDLKSELKRYCDE